ncbi:MAG TPA: circularly permuted type 2 ATP-grasp protein [Planctomycetaceae bacterium]|nr:circularly permuted type 2 ATP-grasp protein [Planctomycetaceae bacterium]
MPATAETAEELFQSYTPRDGVYDEFFAAPGAPRPQAVRFLEELRELDLVEWERRREQAWRQIDENSVTFSAGGDAEQTNRPWMFDVLPLMLDAAEWRTVSTALAQRARLLNLLLQDLHGQQKVVQRGLLPAALLFAHPGYFRQFHGLRVPDDTFLHLYAADLARANDGQWWVTADRTESPSGLGYMLENRLVSSSLYPDSFRAHQVERIAPFFIALRELLQRLPGRHRDNPRVVLLSQGPANPNYYEDAYLSRYLGYMVVEGEDLAVRDDEVLLKTLGGLLPVDVILRRVDEADCDPLELRGDSLKGVTGLLQTIRSGNVVVANALGTGFMECPALSAFLPKLCRELLGEELQMPSVRTWWCGGDTARAYVLEHLDELVIRPCYGDSHEPLSHGRGLSRGQLDDLAAQIRRCPGDYVAQQPIERSTAPVWLRGEVEPWHVALRTYLVASGRSYVCLPGGLARSSPRAQTLDLSISRGESSKDAWVMASGPVTPVSLLKPPGYIQELKRSGAELPSRIADNLFWLGRHAERAEGTGRLLRTLVTRISGEAVGSPDLPLLLRALAEMGQIEPGYAVDDIRPQLPPIEAALTVAVYDPREANSLRSTIGRLNRTASLVRERLSLDSWRLINQIYHEFEPDEDADLTQLQLQLNRLIIDLSAFSGLVAESMTRTLGWRFLDIGRRVERALQTMLVIRNLLLPTDDHVLPALEGALEVADSLLTYRSRYLTNLQLAPVLDLLITDETNPRSLVYQLVVLNEHLDELPRDKNQPLRSNEQRIGMAALHNVRILSADLLISMHTPGERRGLSRLLNRVAALLPKLVLTVSNKFLIHAGSVRQLTEMRNQGLR